MHADYDFHTAEHYATFRPQLHVPILEKCLGKEKKYEYGLDVGSGTGHSSIALAHFCNRVIGVEPSTDMLQRALPHPQVRYHGTIAGDAYYSSDFFDVITFAGSLYYAKSQALLDEISKAGKVGCQVVVYDFDIVIDELLKKLEIKPGAGGVYEHQADFSGLQADQLKLSIREVEKTSITLNTSEVSHVILAVNGYRLDLIDSYGKEGLYAKLNELLISFSDRGNFTFDVKLFYSVYRIEK